jgi:hypothetical protein
MTKLSDKEIQELLEGNKNQVTDDNTKLYSKVFEALKTEPNYELSPNFTSNVISVLEAKSDKTERIIYVIGILGMIVSIVLTLALIVIFAGDTMLKYIPYVLVSSAVLILIQYFDRMVLKMQG